MASIQMMTAPNGLLVHPIEIPGARSLTALVAFNAGSRMERREENGIAHFLEHLVFKGGQKYDSSRKVNTTAEGIGAVLNAYTSHDLVAFHITSRAQVTREALDLLTDFVGRPLIDPEELDRERGVVIQEIARAEDQPATVAEHLIDQAAFGEHPLGRPVLGPTEHIQTFTRDQVVQFREREWRSRPAALFLVGNLSHVPEDGELTDLISRFDPVSHPTDREPAPALNARCLVDERDSHQSHLRISYRVGLDPTDIKQRAALIVLSTLLGGSMGSRLFHEIRENRGLAYSVYSIEHMFADAAILQVSAGLESQKCIEAYKKMRSMVDELRTTPPADDEVARARAYAAGRLAISFENTTNVARTAARYRIVYNEQLDPDIPIAAIDATTADQVAEIAGLLSENFAVSCVGPHRASEFELI